MLCRHGSSDEFACEAPTSAPMLRHDLRMGSSHRSADANAVQGDYGEQWLEIVAAAHGIDHGRVATTDLDKADVQLTVRGEVNGYQSPTVKVQVKTTTNLRRDTNGDMLYDLDVDAHNFLCKTNHSTGRILVVVALSDDEERVRVTDEGTLLLGGAAWVSLQGVAPSSNKESQVVRVPASNVVDGRGLERMVGTYGVPRTSAVPEYDPWKDEGVS